LKLKVISFDLDGTLIDQRFVEAIWFEGLPSLYAKLHHIHFDEAKNFISKEYDKIGNERLEWYDIKYWFRKFLGHENWLELFESMKSRIDIYPEAPKVLKELEDAGYSLVIASNSGRAFLDFELEQTGIQHYFKHVFSSTSDFNVVKKEVNFYMKICKLLNISPREVAHVGDNWKFDFEVPRRLGIKAFYLDRSRKQSGEFTLHNLEALNGIIRKTANENSQG